MKILIVAPSASNHYGESRLTRDLVKMFRSSGNTVAHIALGHEYTAFNAELGETFSTLKDHSQCCQAQGPVLEYQNGHQLGYLIYKEGQMVPWEKEVPCQKGRLMEEDLHATQTFTFSAASQKPDLVITLGSYQAGVAVTASPLRRSFKHVHYVTMEGTSLPEVSFGGADDASIRTLLASADAIVTNSEAANKELIRRFGSDASALVIPEGIDTDTFVQLPTEAADRLTRTNRTNLVKITKDGGYSLDIEDLSDTFNILSIARNTERKNIPLLFEAVDQMRHETPGLDKRDVRLILHVPADVYRGWHLSHLVDKYKAWDWAYIHYQYNPDFHLDDKELNSLFSIADVYLSMSSAESWNTAAMQAVSASVPVVTPLFPTSHEWGDEVLFETQPLMTILKPGTHVEWVMPDTKHSADGLKRAYEGTYAPDNLRSTALKYDWFKVKQFWTKLTDSFNLGTIINA